MHLPLRVRDTPREANEHAVLCARCLHAQAHSDAQRISKDSSENAAKYSRNASPRSAFTAKSGASAS
jgi:hypothetical protein